MDWQTLSDRLKAMGMNLGKDMPATPKHKVKHPIESIVDGEFEETVFGPVFCKTQTFPLDHTHGAFKIVPNSSIATLSRWAKVPHITDDALDNIVYIDTETTGLSGGAGTFAFMVGVGRFSKGQFTLAQYFLRHPGEEPALLAALTRFMSPVDAIVSYNGKAFDVPLLRTRYTLQGLTFPLENVAHFDLLTLARRLWRDRLPSCNLSTIENQILGVSREDEEVPGYAIPELYTEYLRWGDAHPMAGIFYHNAIDILSLTSLFAHASDMLDTPFENQPEEAVDVAAIGKLYQSLGDPQTAMALFEQSLQADLPESIFWNTLERAAGILKRQGDIPSAVRFWEKAALAGHLDACEELAKVYEHRQRDYPIAIRWTEHALKCLAASTLPAHQCLAWKHSLTHRLERLERKLAG